MAHLWAIPVAIAAYAAAKAKADRTQRYQAEIDAGLPLEFTLRVTGPPEHYLDTSPLMDEWEQGDVRRPWQRYKGVPWGVQQQLKRERMFEVPYYVNSHVTHRSRKYIGNGGGPHWNFSLI